MKYFVLSALLAGQMARCQENKTADNKATSPKLHIMATGAGARVSLQADDIERGTSYPSVIRLKGNVEVKTRTVVQQEPLSLMIMVVHADEADYHEDTGEIEARGNVHVDYRDDPGKIKPVGNVRIKLETAGEAPSEELK
jgi:lipopolysaccharide assembly outer membrane protein LptD (OstA)